MYFVGKSIDALKPALQALENAHEESSDDEPLGELGRGRREKKKRNLSPVTYYESDMEVILATGISCSPTFLFYNDLLQSFVCISETVMNSTISNKANPKSQI